jgi:orotidine-5'-phosphate decarboxylase
MVIRAEALPLAMQQRFWDMYRIGKALGVQHPVTQQPTDRNPALLSSTRNEVPAALDASALDQYITRGGIVLTCNQAFREIIAVIVKAERVSPEEGRTRALALLVPGVRLQPSGVFAVMLAQEAGARYIKAS